MFSQISTEKVTDYMFLLWITQGLGYESIALQKRQLQSTRKRMIYSIILCFSMNYLTRCPRAPQPQGKDREFTNPEVSARRPNKILFHKTHEFGSV